MLSTILLTIVEIKPHFRLILPLGSDVLKRGIVVKEVHGNVFALREEEKTH